MKIFAAIALGLAATTISASDDVDVFSVTKAEVDALRILAPEIAAWTKASPGVFSGTDAGEIVTIYTGEYGKRQYEHKLRRDLQRASALATHKNSRKAEAGAEWIASIQLDLEQLTADRVTAKVTQHEAGLLYPGCNSNVPFSSTFVANPAVVDQPSVTAWMGTPVFAGPAPIIYSAYRSVRANLFGDDFDFQASYDTSDSLEASVSVLTFGGQCEMETDHYVELECSPGTVTWMAITRSQSCSGVLNGDPIDEDTTWG